MTSRPAAPESETPEVEEYERRLDRWYPSGFDRETNEWLSWPALARSLERRLSLAQTEIKGHMRVVDELKAELERERMRVVGCSVAALGNWKEGDSLHADYDCVAIRDVAKLRVKYDEAQARIAELEKDAAIGRYVRKHLTGGSQHIVYSMVISQRDLDAIDAALKDRA